MCGRYTAAKNFEDMVKLAGLVMRLPFFAPRYNIAPTQLAPVICLENESPVVKPMRWGLIPSWAKDETTGNALINARLETVSTRRAFRQAYEKRRCLIPADGFFEWKEMHGQRQPFRVMLKSGEPFCFAGLWERWIKPPSAGNFDTDLEEAPPSETVESFTIITMPANKAVAPLHDRMPFIVARHFFETWLGGKSSALGVLSHVVEHPVEFPLKIYPVGSLVNNPKTDDVRCIQPVRIDRDFFERQWWGDE
jgi:putative SOS response-associated peptidase YedK